VAPGSIDLDTHQDMLLNNVRKLFGVDVCTWEIHGLSLGSRQ
jgi:hypothetical protein